MNENYLLILLCSLLAVGYGYWFVSHTHMVICSPLYRQYMNKTQLIHIARPISIIAAIGCHFKKEISLQAMGKDGPGDIILPLRWIENDSPLVVNHTTDHTILYQAHCPYIGYREMCLIPMLIDPLHGYDACPFDITAIIAQVFLIVAGLASMITFLLVLFVLGFTCAVAVPFTLYAAYNDRNDSIESTIEDYPSLPDEQ